MTCARAPQAQLASAADPRPGLRPLPGPGYDAGEGGAQVSMQKYVCTVCGYVYDPAEGDATSGVKPGTPFDTLPADWACPVCGAGKQDFEPGEG